MNLVKFFLVDLFLFCYSNSTSETSSDIPTTDNGPWAKDMPDSNSGRLTIATTSQNLFVQMRSRVFILLLNVLLKNKLLIILFSTGDLEAPDSRYQCGSQLLRSKSANKQFSVLDMMAVLRDEPSGICRPGGSFPTAGSQVSLLGDGKTSGGSCHWFTATPSPGNSVFKPFIFGGSSATPQSLTDATCCVERDGDRQHRLWSAHARSSQRPPIAQLAALEAKYVVLGLQERESARVTGSYLFSEAVAEELAVYAEL